MAAPAFRAVGTAANTATRATNITPGMPTGWAADDIAIMYAAISIIGSSPLVPPSFQAADPTGWTKIDEATINNGTNTRGVRAAWYWRRLVDLDASPNLQMQNNGSGGTSYCLQAAIAAYPGCITSGDPWDVKNVTSSTGGTSVSIPGVTTTVADTRVILAIGTDNDNTVTSQSTTDPGALTENFDLVTTTGSDAGVSGASAAKASTGATGDGTATMLSTNPRVLWLIALKPPAVGGGPAPPVGKGLPLLGVGR